MPHDAITDVVFEATEFVRASCYFNLAEIEVTEIERDETGKAKGSVKRTKPELQIRFKGRVDPYESVTSSS